MATSSDDRESHALDRRRFLKVIAHVGAGRSLGSGYLLSDRLVLTAEHVVRGAERIGVKPVGGDWTPAELLWCGQAGSGPDIALLRLQSAPAPVAAVMCGRLDGRTAFGFTVVGYPLAQSRTTDGVELRDSEEVLGFLTPLTGLESGMVTLHAATTAPSPLPDGRSPWAGMSGSAVLVGGTVAGVVVHDPAAFGPDRLVAQPVTSIWDDPSAEVARAALVEAGVKDETLQPADGGRIGGPGSYGAPAEPSGVGDPTEGGEHVVGERISTAVDVFTDRVELRARLQRIIADNEVSLVAVFGRRGIGKSGLVAKVMAGMESGSLLDGICYLSSRTGNNRLDLSRILGSAARLLPESRKRETYAVIESAGHSPGEKCAVVLDALAEHRWVLVLDDVDHLQDSTGEITDADLLVFLGAVARAVHSPTVLMTSRLPPLFPAALLALRMAPLEMESGIPAADGAQLLLRLDALRQARMKDLTEQERMGLVESVHGIPRALELLVGVRARNPLLPPTQLAAKLRALPAVLDELVSTTYSELEPTHLAVVRVVAVVGTPVDADVVIDLCRAVDPGTGEYVEALNDVVGTRVLGIEGSTGRVRLHPLDAETVLDGLPAEGAWSLAAVSRVVADWYGRRAVPESQWRSWSDVDSSVAEARHRIRAGESDRALQVLLAVARAGPKVGHGAMVLSLLEKLRPGLSGSEELASHALARAIVHHRIGPRAAAIVAAEEAQEGFSATGQTMLQAEAAAVHGDALRGGGRFSEAVQRCQAALELFRSAVGADHDPKDDDQLGQILLRLGLAQIYARDPDAAAVTADALATLEAPEGDPKFRALRADLLSLARLLDGAPDEAIVLAEEGVRLYAQSSLEPDNATFVHNVAGLGHLRLGSPGDACKAFTAGLDMATALLIPRPAAFNAYNLTWARVLNGQAVEAGAAADRAAAAFLEDGGQEVAVARALEACLAAVRRGDTENALRGLSAVTALASPNPELYVPSNEALQSITALIQASSEGWAAALSGPDGDG